MRGERVGRLRRHFPIMEGGINEGSDKGCGKEPELDRSALGNVTPGARDRFSVAAGRCHLPERPESGARMSSRHFPGRVAGGSPRLLPSGDSDGGAASIFRN